MYSENKVKKFEKDAMILMKNRNLEKYYNNELEGKIIFSILIPTYNREKLIKRAIDSVLNQTFPYFELIIIDDASTDNTQNIVQSINDSRIVYIKHEVNKGQNPAYNTGLRIAQGKYISFLDSDDEWLQTKLEETYKKFISDNELGLVYHLGGMKDNNSELVLQRHDYLEGYIEKEVLTQSYLTSPTMETVKKSCFDVIGFLREDITTSKDDDMNFLFVKHFKVGFIDKILGIYYLNSGNRLGDNKEKVAYGWYQLYLNHEEDFIRAVGKKILVKHYKNNVLTRFKEIKNKKMILQVSKKIFSLEFSFKNFINLLKSYYNILKSNERSL